MRKIIQGKRYDTNTARSLHSYRVQDGDTETLYISPNGQLFVVRWSSYINLEDDSLGEENLVDIDWTLLETGGQEVMDWLEKGDAPESAYEDAGFIIEEG